VSVRVESEGRCTTQLLLAATLNCFQWLSALLRCFGRGVCRSSEIAIMDRSGQQLVGMDGQFAYYCRPSSPIIVVACVLATNDHRCSVGNATREPSEPASHFEKYQNDTLFYNVQPKFQKC